MAKVGAGQLSHILEQFKTPYDPNLLVGYSKADDASVYKVSDDTAVVNTVDFFPPVCDDPYRYGQIAAANALSDVYAMGGRPIVALNIMAITSGLPEHIISEILRGGYDKAGEAGCIITGGHTITSKEPLYGLAVTGLINPNRIWSNDEARVGDKLVLTKPLGTGILLTAFKADADLLSAEELEPVLDNMAKLNRVPSEVASRHNVSCVTDITGFGLAGHALEIADGSNVTLSFRMSSLPLYPQAVGLAEMGILPSGAYSNRNHVADKITFGEGITQAMQDVTFDPQTSGGLLIGIAPDEVDALVGDMRDAGVDAVVVGEVLARGDTSLVIV